MSNLIFSAVGNPILFHDDYDKDNHYRFTKKERNYDTIICCYNDFVPEDNSYDVIYHDKGFKWQIVNKFLQMFDYSDYEYVAFFDDDVITDIQSINRAIEIAKQNDFKLFQMSMKEGSESAHSILWQDKNLIWSKTSFVEGMGTFFHSSILHCLVDFFKIHDAKTGWGLDIIFGMITKTTPVVIHEVSMFHPPKDFGGYSPSYYDNTEAMNELNYILNDVYPRYMKMKYNEDTGPYAGSHNAIYEVMNK
jgi:hypothetical protein